MIKYCCLKVLFCSSRKKLRMHTIRSTTNSAQREQESKDKWEVNYELQ